MNSRESKLIQLYFFDEVYVKKTGLGGHHFEKATYPRILLIKIDVKNSRNEAQFIAYRRKVLYSRYLPLFWGIIVLFNQNGLFEVNQYCHVMMMKMSTLT